MIDPYIQQVLRVIVAQICLTIGWHSIQTTPLELLVDILHKYLHEITRNIIRYTELYNRIEPSLDDVGLAFRELNINLHEIEEYVNYVQPIPCNIDVPNFPVHKDSNFNFLKPGSKEVITRPMFIPEYLPPIYPEREEETLEKQLEICDTTTDTVVEVNSNHSETTVNNVQNENTDNDENKNNLEINNQTSDINADDKGICFINKNENHDKMDSQDQKFEEQGVGLTDSKIVSNGVTKTEKNSDIKIAPSLKTLTEISTIVLDSLTVTSSGSIPLNGQNLSKFVKPRLPYEVEGRPTREISSVMMTSSGFISPAREGKLPDCKIPIITEPRPVRSPSPPPPAPITSKTPMGGKQAPQVSLTTVQNFQSKAGHQNISKQEKSNHQYPSSSVANSNKSNEMSQLPNYDPKYLKKLKRKNLLAFEKEQRKLEKLNSISVSKQLFLQKQQHKMLKQQQKQLLKLQKQQKQQQKLSAPPIVTPFATTGSNPLEPIITNSDVIMPTSNVLSDERISKLSKKHKGMIRKQRELLLNIMQNRQTRLILNPNEKNSVGPINNPSAFNISPNNNGGFDKQTLAILQQHQSKKLENSKETPLKSSSIIAQQQALVAQLSTESSITDLPTNLFNQTGTVLPPGFPNPSSLMPSGSTNALPSTVNLPAKPNAEDGKINESEKGKLNLFKKDAANKKDLNDSANLALDHLIHLPSGTTITPATDNISSTSTNLVISVQTPSKNGTVISQVTKTPKLPTGTDQIICIDDDDNLNNINNKANIKSENIPLYLTQQSQSNENNNNSSNQLGINSSLLMVSSGAYQHPIKSEKKLKRKHQQNEPLNLSNDKIIHSAIMSATNISPSAVRGNNKNDSQEQYLEQQMLIQQQYALATKMMKKERKKPKLKENKKSIQANLSQQSSAAAAVLAAAHQQYIQNLAAAAAATSLTPSVSNVSSTQPTLHPTENLAAINKKLMKIDTVMQPAPPSLQSNANSVVSPKSTSNAGNNQKQHKSNQPSISAANALSLTFPYPPFPYTFPSRPGLIPTPGIFPSLPPALDKFLPIMPFSKFNSLKSTNSTLDDIKQLSSTVKSNLTTNQQLGGLDLEKNYCNVAPLVPESMIQNFKLSPTKSSKQNKQKSSQDLLSLKTSENRHFGFQSVKLPLLNKATSQNNFSHNDAHTNIIDATIEISDDEKIKSDSEEKVSQLQIDSLVNQATQQTSTFSKSMDSGNLSSSHTETSNSISAAVTTNNSKNIAEADSHKPSDQVIFASPNTKAGSMSLTQQMTNTKFNSVELEDIRSFLQEKRKEHHKKNKKTKEGKIKKKKDKKDKSKNKDKSEKKKDKEDRIKDKEKLKKQKKEKKKEKLRQLSIGSATSITSGGSSVNINEPNINFDSQPKTKYHNAGNEDIVGVTSNSTDLIKSSNNESSNSDNLTGSSVPKLTLILGIGKSPTPDSVDNNRKILIKSLQETENSDLNAGVVQGTSAATTDQNNAYKKELSPELARISPLVTRPPKQKSNQQLLNQYNCNQQRTELLPHNEEQKNINNRQSNHIVQHQTNLTSLIDLCKLNQNINQVIESSYSNENDDEINCNVYNEQSTIETSLSTATTTMPKTTLETFPSNLIKNSQKNIQNLSLNISMTESHDYKQQESQQAININNSFNEQNNTNINRYLYNADIPSSFGGGSNRNNNNDSNITKTSEFNSTAAAVTATAATSTFNIRNTTNITNSSTSGLLSAENSRPSSYIDADGNQVWICPACGRVDDGTPMIGCDGCDAWYHWVCVGIQVPPDDSEDWYCRVCIAKKQATHESDKKKKRKKKSKQTN